MVGEWDLLLSQRQRPSIGGNAELNIRKSIQACAIVTPSVLGMGGEWEYHCV